MTVGRPRGSKLVTKINEKQNVFIQGGLFKRTHEFSVLKGLTSISEFVLSIGMILFAMPKLVKELS